MQERNNFKKSVFIVLNILFLIIFSNETRAEHGTFQIGYPLTINEVLVSLMLSNPPLPMTDFEKGDREVTALVSRFIVSEPGSLEPDEETGTQIVTSSLVGGDQKGWGAGVMYQWAYSDRWSFYGTMMGTQLGSGSYKGKVTDEEKANIEGGGSTVGAAYVFQTADSDSSFSFALGIGANYKLIPYDQDSDEEQKFTASIFGGPLFVKTGGSGRSSVLQNPNPGSGNVKTTNSSACEDSISGYVCVGRVYEGVASNLIAMIGIQANYKAFWNLVFNPYVLYFPLIPDEESNDREQIKVDPDVYVFTKGSPSEFTSYKRGFSDLAFGLNVTHAPTGISANIFGFLTEPIIADSVGLDGFDIVKLQISKTFQF